MSTEAKRPTIFYGWFVVAACFAVTLTLGETFWSFGVFFKPLETEFGWSRTLVSSGYTSFLIGYAISTVTTGRLADRYSPRPILLVCSILAGLGISLCSLVQDINQLRGFLFLSGLGAGATWSVPTSVTQRWFANRKRAGLALALVGTGVGIGAIVFAPLINYLILTYGWRNAYLTVGILFFVIIAMATIVIKRNPQDTSGVSGTGSSTPKSFGTQGWTTGKAVATRSYIGILFMACVAVIAFQIISVHLVPHATDVGISPTASAAALGMMGAFSIPGRLLSGYISERISWPRILAFAAFGMALSVIWLLLLKATWMLYCFVFFYGTFHGGRITASTGIMGKFFGMRSLGELIGISTAISNTLGAFGPYLAGFIFDTTGSYSAAFIMIIGLMLCAGVVGTIMKEPVAKAN